MPPPVPPPMPPPPVYRPPASVDEYIRMLGNMDDEEMDGLPPLFGLPPMRAQPYAPPPMPQPPPPPIPKPPPVPQQPILQPLPQYVPQPPVIQPEPVLQPQPQYVPPPILPQPPPVLQAQPQYAPPPPLPPPLPIPQPDSYPQPETFAPMDMEPMETLEPSEWTQLRSALLTPLPAMEPEPLLPTVSPQFPQTMPPMQPMPSVPPAMYATQPTPPPMAQPMPPPLRQRKKHPWPALVLNVLLFLFVGVVIGGTMVFLFSSKPNKSFFGFYFYNVESGSMAPTQQENGETPKDGFREGDAIVVKKIAPEDILVGDIITFQVENKKTPRNTHRVRAIRDQWNGETGLFFVTKGDANQVQDDLPVSGDMVIGKKILTLPYLGRLMRLADQHPYMFIGCSAALILILLVLFILLSRPKKKKIPPPPVPMARPPEMAPQLAPQYAYQYNV